MEKGYRYLPLFFILVLTLAPIGFKNYLTRLLEYERQHFYVHFHALLMTIWCIILIVQPLLIIKKKRKLHQWIGKFSYVLTPILVVSMFMMLYHSLLVGGMVKLAVLGVQHLFFPASQILIFSIFYLMAMGHIKNPRIHMRYIVVSSVSLLGPTIGRIDFTTIGFPSLDWDLLAMEGFLLGFILWDKLKSKSMTPYIIGFLSFLAVHVLIACKFEETRLWETVGFHLAELLIWVF